MSRRLRLLLPLLVAAFGLTAAPGYGQQGKRATLRDVTDVIKGEELRGYGPADLPRPPFSDDGRPLIYLNPVFVTAVRDRRPARTYSFWARLTLAKDAPDDLLTRKLPMIRDAMALALSDITQVDWPGDARIDLAVASSFAQERVDAAVGGGVLDAIDFLHIEVQVF